MYTAAKDKPTVLVVDDELKNIQVVGGFLVREGFEILPARDGETALKRAKAGKPDLILLDVMMPGMDGFAVCKALKSSTKTRDIPVIFLSASTDKDFVLEAFEKGGVDYLHKPFFFPELLSRVSMHLELRTTQREMKEIIQKRSDLLAVMAHDLKNPISAVQMSSQLLSELSPESDGNLKTLIETIHTSAQDALNLIESILNADAAENVQSELKSEEVNLNKVLAQCSAQHQLVAEEKGICLSHQPSPKDLVARVDKQAVQRILDNLISNAVKFTPSGGTVTILSKKTPTTACIEISDTGQGFSEEDKKQIFSRYARLSAKPTGDETSTGIGLSIVKDLVDRMGGMIAYESEQGKGTTFTVQFPVAYSAISSASRPFKSTRAKRQAESDTA